VPLAGKSRRSVLKKEETPTATGKRGRVTSADELTCGVSVYAAINQRRVGASIFRKNLGGHPPFFEPNDTPRPSPPQLGALLILL
jgi:hypothetical protein